MNECQSIYASLDLLTIDFQEQCEEALLTVETFILALDCKTWCLLYSYMIDTDCDLE